MSNRFADLPMMPPTLRVVPTKMAMRMHMLGMMYAPTDRLTLMGMVDYLDSEMEHLVFRGPAGTERLGTFTTSARGLGDVSLSVLINLADGSSHRWHATAGLSLPTGDVDVADRVLTPMGTRSRVRLPYPMQLGSGTYDLIGGLTWAGGQGRWGWGSQWRSVVRLGEGDEGYSLGDEHRLQGWISYLAHPALSLSGRLGYLHRGNVDGSDPLIRAPVQSADLGRQGGELVDAAIGANLLLPGGRHRVALELATPLHQRLDGPQLERDWQVTLGWQFAP